VVHGRLKEREKEYLVHSEFILVKFIKRVTQRRTGDRYMSQEKKVNDLEIEVAGLIDKIDGIEEKLEEIMERLSEIDEKLDEL
jgi:peptidoglycan hydrolase CwlO-like protein